MSEASTTNRLGSLSFAVCLMVLMALIGIDGIKIGGIGKISGSTYAQSGQSYTWRNVTINGGGFVPGIIFNSAEPNLIYARTDIGGAYRWNQATQSWTPLMDFVGFDDWNLMGVDTLATDPVDPGRLYIVGGTYTNEWTSQNGVVFRSTDRGNTFQRTNLPFKSGGNMPGRSMGERLAIDPNRNSILYLGARSGNGLWRSTDFGVTWSKVNNFPNTGPYFESGESSYTADPQGVVWVTFDKRTGTPGNTTQTIYVGVADKATSIYRSTDGGATWAAVPGQPTGYLPHHGILASTGMLYISYSDGGGPYDGEKGDVWKFNTATGAWTNISPVPSSSSDDYFGYGGLTVDAQHPDTVMVAALNSWWPDTIIFRSLDGGATWTRIWDWAAYPNRTFRYVQDISAAPWLTFNNNPAPPEVTPKLGWMVGSLVIDPFNSDRMMYGTGATIYGTTNLTSWDSGNPINISVMVKGLEETAVLDLISPPSGAPLISGLGDINGFRHGDLTVAPASMFSTPGFAAGSLDYAELNPNFVVRSGNADAGIIRAAFSFDGASNWFAASTEPGGTSGGGTIAAAANASRVVWSPDGAVAHYSTNNGGSWTASMGLPTGARVASDRVNPMKFYGFANGTFYISTNGGANFAAATTGLPASARIKAMPGREGDVWLAGGEGGLWHTTNSGASFTQLTNLERADGIGFGKAAPGQSYMALYSIAQANGVRGIFRSDNGGTSWTRINDDQHQFGISTSIITGDPRIYGRVYIGTNGRGIIQGDIGTAAPAPDFSILADPSSLTIGRGTGADSTVSITRLGGFADPVTFSASGLPSGVTATIVPTGESGATLTLAASSTAASGPATVTITGTGGGLTRTTNIGLTVSSGGNGGVTITAAANTNGPWFNEEAVVLSNTANVTALTVTIVLQRSQNIGFSGMYNTIGGIITQANNSTATTITYQFTMAAGATLGAGTNRIFAAQSGGSGTTHVTTGDTYTVTYTIGGQNFTQTGHF